MEKSELEALIAEATVDCYDEHEAFMGILVTLDMRLHFPLTARALGETVEVVGLNESRSSLRRGILARVCKDGQERNVVLSELEFIDPDPVSAKWLAAYRYWLGEAVDWDG